MISSPRARWRMFSRRALAAPATAAPAITAPATAAPAMTAPAISAPATTAPALLRAVALAGAVTLLAGCGSGSPAATPATTVTVHASASPSPAAAATGSPSASTGPASASPGSTGTAAAACPTRYLSVKPGLAQGAAGSTYQVLDFTNISSVTCTLYGYPGVSLAGGKPVTQIGLAAARTNGTPVKLVTLAPRAVASALLRIVAAANFPAAKCHLVTATYLQIYPPDQTTPSYLAYRAQACTKPVQTLFIDAIRPGSGG